ncbi:M23 family metallopeptidase [Vallitalea guaymasensis]|uniref:M23 family metallopeptidase n=1 Tax=Vallitalea guaymasensis TaxID=1185412 RepID=A0A8J8SBR3_9FIRM|nr:M23 family metallopeptidase [Vallitalea guaymasensis]QUH28631.1 M23 family metallopeptidase [Vallitalea guaymasensis]
MSNLRWALRDADTYSTSQATEKIGSIDATEEVEYLNQKVNGYAYIEYSTIHGRKKAWVYANNLTATKPPREIGIMPVGTKFRSPTDFPNYQSGGFHGGTDIASNEGAAEGDPIKASFAGKVVDVVTSVKGVDHSKGFGNYVKIKSLINGKNYYTYYCHMLYGSVKVSKGNTVSKEQVIGKMGNTGHSYGAHLHLEYRVMPYSPRASHVVDPRKFY